MTIEQKIKEIGRIAQIVGANKIIVNIDLYENIFSYINNTAGYDVLFGNFGMSGIPVFYKDCPESYIAYVTTVFKPKKKRNKRLKSPKGAK